MISFTDLKSTLSVDLFFLVCVSTFVSLYSVYLSFFLFFTVNSSDSPPFILFEYINLRKLTSIQVLPLIFING